MLTYERFTSPQMVYCERCGVRIVGKRDSFSFPPLSIATVAQRGNQEALCETCYKKALTATGTPPSAYKPRCAACQKDVDGSARIGPDGVICHDCYDRSPEGEAEIAAMREWWRTNDLDRRRHALQPEQVASEASPVLDLNTQRKRRAASTGTD